PQPVLSRSTDCPWKLHSFPTRRSSDLKALARQQEELIKTRHTLRKPYKKEELDAGDLSALQAIFPASGIQCFYFPLRSAEGTYLDRKSTRLNSSHVKISYAVFCLKKRN